MLQVLNIILFFPNLERGSEFLSCRIELRNQVMQNDLTYRVSNSDKKFWY